MDPSRTNMPISWKDQSAMDQGGSHRLPDPAVDEEGCPNKRPLNPRQPRPQSQPTLLQTERSIPNLRLESCDKKGGNLSDKYSDGKSVLNIGQPTTKDVDFFTPKMQDISHPARKRKQQHHSSDRSLSIAPRSSSLPQSEGEVNGENEGVATSCKRVRVSMPDSRGDRHSSSSRLRSQFHSRLDGASLEQMGLELTPNKLDFERETSDQDESVSRKGAKFEAILFDNDDSGMEYNTSPRQISNLRSSARLSSATMVARKERRVVGPKKKDLNLSVFKPRNSLKGHIDISLPRQGPKIFDFTLKDESPATKRRKFGNERLLRRGSSNSVLHLPEGSRRGTTDSPSSFGSRPIKSEQSLNGDARRQRIGNICLGAVGEYNKVEALISQPRKTIRAPPDRKSNRSGISTYPAHSTRTLQPRVLLSKSSAKSAQGTKPAGISTSIEKDEVADIQGGRPDQNLCHNSGNGLEDVGVAEGSITNLNESRMVNELELKSHFFEGPQRRNEPADSQLLGDAKTSEQALNAHLSAINRPMNHARKPGSPAEGNHSPYDSIDLLHPHEILEYQHQKVEVQILSRKVPRKYPSKPQSKSISTEGDISGGVAQTWPRTSTKTQHLPNSTFSLDFFSLKSGAAAISVMEECQPWQLQYNSETKAFDIAANGELVSVEDPLIVKPEKLRKVTYHTQCGKVLLNRRRDSDFHSGEMHVLVEMHNPLDGFELTQFLQTKNNSIITAAVENPEQMDKIFTHMEAQFTKAIQHADRKPPQAEIKPLDVVLLERKESRSVAKRNRAAEASPDYTKSPVDGSRPFKVGRQLHPVTEASMAAGPHRRNTVVGKMIESAAEEASAQSRSSKTDKDAATTSMLRTPVVNKSQGDHRPNTRGSSARQHNHELALQPTKQRSPSPVRWTEQHPNWVEVQDWKNPLIFPAAGRKQQAMVVAEDIVRLDEGNFLNDNLIALYLRYLEDRLEMSNPELSKRIYFQNTFFYASLTKGKVRSNNINYEAVKRWSTKAKVDIFSYDYIVVPVNENLHWYVAIIYNAPKLLLAAEGGNQQSQTLGGQVNMDLGNADDIDQAIYEGISTVPRSPQAATSKQIAANPADRTSASPSVTVQVEQMSLEDTTEDWPELDAMPEDKRSAMVQLKRPLKFATSIEDLQDAGSDIQDSPSQALARRKRPKRKSIPTPRKQNKNVTKIITLDSLGGSHSPTCSNLLEYLVCEGRERHGVEIQASRLGMTAKGLPQQSNHCDCGVYVLGYMEKFLKDPDRFVQDILSGEMAVDRGWEEMNAPRLRENIRRLIFHLQSQQARQQHKQQLQSKSKKVAMIQTKVSESSKSPSGMMKSVSAGSSKAVTPTDLNAASSSLASSRQPIVVPTDDNEMDRARPDLTKRSPVEIDDEDVTFLEKTPGFGHISAAKPRGPKSATFEAAEMEPSTSRSQDRKTARLARRNFTSSGVKVERGSAPTRSSPSRSRAISEEFSVPGGSFSSKQAIFRQFCKPSINLPNQHTRSKLQYGSNEDEPLSIDEMDGFEIPESPTEQAAPESPFQDISELTD